MAAVETVMTVEFTAEDRARLDRLTEEIAQLKQRVGEAPTAEQRRRIVQRLEWQESLPAGGGAKNAVDHVERKRVE